MGGDSSAVASQLNGTVDVAQIYSSIYAFAALRNDGSVVTWGAPSSGGDSASVANALDGTVNVTNIHPTMYAFAAIRSDGSVVTWGDSFYGGDSSKVAKALNGNIDVKQVYSNKFAFVALRTDGSVVTWGSSGFGGDSSSVASFIDGTVDVMQIFSTGTAFAALRTDGSVITWGNSLSGGDSTSVASKLDGTVDVVQVVSADTAFAALRADGSVVTWGNSNLGGDSSAVASQLSSGVVGLADIYTDDVFSDISDPNPPLLSSDEIFEAEGLTGGDELDASIIGALDAGKIKVMADFSKAAYHLQEWEKIESNTLTDNPLINDEKNGSSQATSDVVNQGWEPIIDLNPTLTSPDNNIVGVAYMGLDVTNQMVNGFYTNGNAAAFVARSKDAIVISFRGTNDTGKFYSPDMRDWTLKPYHYELMRPLVEAVEQYIQTHGIHKVYVTGHSLGGAMAIKFMDDHANGSFGANYEGVTFAAPSYALPIGLPDSRMTLIEIEGDIVPDFGGNNGRTIHFVGDKTNNSDTAYHSMDYYRQMVDSVDNVAWNRIISESGNQYVYIGGQMVSVNSFIVDGLQSGGENLPASGIDGAGNNELTDPPSLLTNYNIFYGGRGVDALTGGGAKELMLGGSGNDILYGNGDADRLFGDVGDDILIGGVDLDTMIGGIGNDSYSVDNAGDIVTESVNQGTDDVSSEITYTLPENVENLVLNGVSPINGTGNNLANIIIGNIYANQLNGQAGNDTLNGGAGNDTLTGWSGADIMIGGSGNDAYFVENASDVVTENLNEGTDVVSSRLTYTLPVHVENLILTGTTTINGTGNDLNNVITGNGAANQLNGQAGNDTLNGGAGNDTLTGWSGADIMIGGSGNDTYFVENAGDIVTESLSAGADTVSSRITYTLPANVENLTLTGTTAINGTGNDLVNVMIGNSAANQLNGGSGNDTLDGGLGNNRLTGGVGNDIFKFTTKNHVDTITDYNVANDTIQLENGIFTALTTTGTLAVGQFRIGAQALDANDFVIYNNVTGALLYDANGSGTGAAVQIATIGVGLAITNADIVVI